MWYIKKLDELDPRQIHQIFYQRSKVFVVEQESAFQDVDQIDIDAWHIYKMDEGQLQAYIRIYLRDNGIVGFGRVLVPQIYRGRGYGTELVSKALEFIEEKYPDILIRIEAEQYLTKFYESFGFEVISEPYLDYDIWHVDMELKK